MSPDPEIHPPVCFVLVWGGQDEKKKGGPGGSPPAPASLMLSQLIVVEEDAFARSALLLSRMGSQVRRCE